MKKITLITFMLIVSALILSMGVSASANEGTTPMYDVNGNVAYIPNSQLDAHHKIGWYYAPVMMMYSPDGSSAVIAQSDYWSYKGWGWYEYPVTTVYDSTCMGKVIPTSELAYWQGQGWYQTNWRKAYADILYNHGNVEYGGQKYSDYSWYDPDFNLVYIDGDNIPELLIRASTVYRLIGVEIYTYKNGLVYTDYNEYGNISRFGMQGEGSYIPKSGLIVSDYFVPTAGAETSIWKIAAGEFTTVFWASYYHDVCEINGVAGGNYYTYINSIKKYTSRAVDGFGSYYYSLTPSNIKAATWY